jgi:hypothetical protein
LLAAGLIVLSCLGCAQHSQHHADSLAATARTPSLALTDQVVEVGCASCMFGLDDRPGCETAIRVNGVVFIATGSAIPDAEDHESGMCESIRMAKVSGQTVGPNFIATRFALLP